MTKLLSTLITLFALFAVSCGDGDEPEIKPIKFERQDYTIRHGVATAIEYADGGGVYELTASNPDVLGKIHVDIENHQFWITPAATGESTLTITDIMAGCSTTLKFTVEDYYLPFIVDHIEGKNNNLYLTVGSEIRFVRDKDNTKRLKIYNLNHVTHQRYLVADGAFDIEKSATNIFTLNMALHHSRTEELETFSYTMGGDWEYLKVFEKYFEYDWDKSVVSKSQPIKRIQMILTDPANGCEIISDLGK